MGSYSDYVQSQSNIYYVVCVAKKAPAHTHNTMYKNRMQKKGVLKKCGGNLDSPRLSLNDFVYIFRAQFIIYFG